MPKNGLLPSEMNNSFCLNELRCLKRVGFCNFDGSKTPQKSSPFKTALKSAGHQGLKCGIVTNVDLAERQLRLPILFNASPNVTIVTNVDLAERQLRHSGF